ncbi:nucleotidyl cyclase domain-containing protein [Sediminispirochaeta smaragdinae]|uniref:GGDEF domain-containing protein n=1 Tax=Sediminispirochaeta smaragdinae (strain DSM 11293 / JCM 15392 / SEBR 4228) TaxID=573413 RepID=E1R9L7_SEDSS|nr:hypothetical protein [Sediminispirochaeta smaragdinae]ADK83186.1 hypothetical protein Spirs_4105 [Sediminispirochaeta smaragdinae DSM 11293]
MTMAKQPPKRYRPGELDRTRNRLGPLSKEEAQRMAELLGGEVGTERDDPILEERYRKLKERAYGDKILQADTLSVSETRENPGISKADETFFRQEGGIKRSYTSRFRIWYLASRPEFAIMRRRTAWAALWPFSHPQELLHPKFVLNSSEIFYRRIETVVLSLRGILRRVEKNRIHQLRSPFYRKIAESIKEWEIEALHRELSRIQLHPRHVSIRDFSRVVFFLYRPFIQLQKLSPVMIQRAFRHLYDLSLLELPKRNLEADRMRRYYAAASSELYYIFETLPVRCFPLLLLLFAEKPMQYRELLDEKEEKILEFFRLNKQEVIDSPAPKSEETPSEEKEPKQTETEHTTAQATDEEQETSDIPEHESIGFRRSLLMLERLFPGSGWMGLSDHPDLFPYFDPILKLPQESGLIPPGDPMQYVVILTAILSELLYGFREAEMGSFLDEKETPTEIAPIFEEIEGNWHRFLDELIEKQYLGTLRDYCRNVERSFDFVLSEYGKRIEADILFLRQRYLFPNLQHSIPKYLRPRNLPPIPKFYESVSQLKTLFACMAMEEGAQSLKNPTQTYRFPVPNTLSRRLDTILDQGEGSRSFKNLARYSYAVTLVLDRILQQEHSAPTPLYRHVDQRQDLPVYSVTSLDTGKLLRRFEARRSPTPDIEELTGNYDELTGLAGNGLVERELCAVLAERSGSTAVLRIRSGCERALESAKRIESELRLFQDQLFRLFGNDFLAILTETEKDTAVEVAKRIAQRLELPEKPGPVISVLIPPEKEEKEQTDVQGLLGEIEASVPAGPLPLGSRIYLWNGEEQKPELL